MPRTRLSTIGNFVWPLLLVSLVAALGCNSLVPRAKKPGEDVYARDMEEEDPDESITGALVGAAAGAAVESINWEDFQPQNLNKLVKKATGNGPNRKIAKEKYLAAEAVYKRAAEKPENQRTADFREAAELYVEAADRWPSSALEQDALFMAGESYFFADYYVAANANYERLIKAFPNSRYLDTISQRRFAIARYWLDVQKKDPEAWYSVNLLDQQRPWRDTHGNALRIYDRIRVDDVGGRLSDDATMAAANEHFVNRQFQKADDYYTDLRKAYPTSEHQFDAHFSGMKAKLMSYLGPNYGGTSLDEADKLIKQMKRQFPKEYAAEREYLDRAAAEIRYKKAEKLFNMAEYFYRRSEYGGAVHYYQRVIKEYEDTPLAQQSQARIAETAGKPAKPQQYAPWLVDLLPKRDKIQRMLDSVEDYEKANPREPKGTVESEILPAAGQQPIGTGR